jgi:hypothetical protein
MKRTFSLLFLLALATSSQAGLITDPLSAKPAAAATGNVAVPVVNLPKRIVDQGLITDPLSINVSPVTPATPPPTNPAARAAIDLSSAKKWINDLIGSQPEGEALRLSDLMMIPDVFEALHATGRNADELRGYMDWLLMTGVVVGLDGDDGLDDLTGDPEDGIILGGPGNDNVRPQAQANGIILGGTGTDTVRQQALVNGIILGGPGTDTMQPQAPVNGFVFGTNSYMNGAPQAPTSGIILGGPGSDNVRQQAPVNGFVFGEVVYLAGDSQDHNPDVAND